MAERIASLLASGTEILYGLGLGNRVVAVSHECDYPPDVAKKPRVTRTRIDGEATSGAIDRDVRRRLAEGEPLYEIDAATLVALAPDLIVTQAQCDVCAVRYQDVVDLVHTQVALQHTAVVSMNPMTLDDVIDDIHQVGEAAGVSSTADRYIKSLRARVAAVRAHTVPLTERMRPRVVCIEWVEPLMVAANWMPQLVEFAGGRHEMTAAGGHTTTTNWSDVLAYDPQVLVVMPCGFDLARAADEVKHLQPLDGWNELTAVKSDRVYAVDGNAYFNRSGPRLVDSLEILAHLLHGDRCPPPADATAWRHVRVE